MTRGLWFSASSSRPFISELYPSKNLHRFSTVLGPDPQQELIVKSLGILQFLVVKLLVACNVPWWEYLFKLLAYQHTYSQESWSIVFEKSKHSTTFQMIQVKLQETSMPMCRPSQPSQG